MEQNETETVIKSSNCRKMFSQPLCEQSHTALKRENWLYATHAGHSLQLPGGIWQACRSFAQIGRADFWSTLRMGLPGCSEQRAGDRAPQLGVGNLFGVIAHRHGSYLQNS